MSYHDRMEKIAVSGGCHCGAVRYTARVARQPEVQSCNCSICAMTGFLHLIVPGSDFTLLRGAEALSAYRFNTGTAQHLFCRHCGVKSYYVPRSNPDGYSINLRCLDENHGLDIKIDAFDGRHWEQHAGTLAHLTAGHAE